MWRVTLMVGLLERDAFDFKDMESASIFAEAALDHYATIGDELAIVIRKVKEQSDELRA